MKSELNHVTSDAATTIDYLCILYTFKEVSCIFGQWFCCNRKPPLFIINLDALIVPTEIVVLALDEFNKVAWNALFQRNLSLILLLCVIPTRTHRLGFSLILVILVPFQPCVGCLLPHYSKV